MPVMASQLSAGGGVRNRSRVSFAATDRLELPMTIDDQARARIDALIQGGENQGCVNLSELSDLVQELELSEEDGQELQERIEARGLEVSDDCGRTKVDATRYQNGDIASTTTDAL